jgi:hypothetical protein
MTQDTYDQHKDFIERDSDGNIIGMWADWYSSNILPVDNVITSDETEEVPEPLEPLEPLEPQDPTDPTPPTPSPTESVITSVVKCTGKRCIKIGGSPKTVAVFFYDESGESVDYQPGNWVFTIDDEDVLTLLTLTYVDDNKVKVKLNRGEEYTNKILTVTFISGEIISSLDLEILPL